MDVAEFNSIRKPRYKDHDEAIVVLPASLSVARPMPVFFHRLSNAAKNRS